ncbi:MAG: elongation factor P [Parachlamydiales bacterium]|nr:elongation factor P [Parachlamydiales bacterium]
MTKGNQITPGMTVKIDGEIYRVESTVKVDPGKGAPFMKTKLCNLMSEKVCEKNFKLDQMIDEVSLLEHHLEYLYPEGKNYLFLDIDNLEQVEISPEIMGNSVDFLKEGIELKALFYGDVVFSVELPQFLELMIVKTPPPEGDNVQVSGATKKAILETGAKINVPLFIETGDVIKVDVHAREYIQRV